MRQIILSLLLVATLQAQQPKEFDWQPDGKLSNVKIHWQIEFLKNVITVGGDSSLYDGMTYCSKHIIQIYLGAENPQEVLFHELMHVVTDCSDKKLTTHNHIYNTSPGMVRLFQTNPELVSFITERK